MQQKVLILIGAGAFLLVLGSTSYGADVPISDPPTVTDPQKVYLIKENPFFNSRIEKAVKHAREAEIAGNLGQAPDLLQHAQLSLDLAREAQRAGSVPGLNEGIAFLRKALERPVSLTEASMEVPPAEVTAHLAQGVNPQCIDELEKLCGDLQPGGGRIQKCFDDKIDSFSPMCQLQLKEEGKAGIGAAIVGSRHQKELVAAQKEKELAAKSREAASVPEVTNYIREARKNLSQAAGMKFVELKPQAGS
jgi:hypothetical protein